MHPGYPVLEGRQSISGDWSVTMPHPLNVRIEGASMVLWRPGFTAWITPWGGDEAQTDRVETLKRHVSPAGFDRHHWVEGGLEYLSYRLAEQATDGRQPALYGFAVAATGHLQFAIYFDTPEQLNWGHALLASASLT